MYYYIFEPPLEAKEYERTAQIKEYLSGLGIAGEMTSPIPGRTVEDLVQLAIGKRYSTVIAVGGIALINQVARALEPYDVVFGIIPFHENSDIGQLIGVSDWKGAANALKRRRWQPVRLGLLDGKLCFLTPATVHLPASAHYSIKTPEFSLEGKGGLVSLTPLAGESAESGSLLLELQGPQPEKRGWFASILKNYQENPRESRFVVENATLTTDQPHSVRVAGADLCTTPVRYETQDRPVRLIMSSAPSASSPAS